MNNCCCRGESDYKVHTPNYCGSVPYEQAFPPYSLEPKCLKGYLPRTNRVKVEITIQLPTGGESATAAQIEEWLRYNLSDNSLLNKQPLSEEALPRPLIFEWEWAR